MLGTKTKHDLSTFTRDAVSATEDALHEAAEATRAMREWRSRGRISAEACIARVLTLAGSTVAQMAETRRTIETSSPERFPASRSLLRTASQEIERQRWARPPAEKRRLSYLGATDLAEAELASIGGNLWMLVGVAYQIAAERAPAAFGALSVEDEAGEREDLATRQHTAALRFRRDVAAEIQIGLAVKYGLAVEPQNNLAERLIDHAVKALQSNGGSR